MCLAQNAIRGARYHDDDPLFDGDYDAVGDVDAFLSTLAHADGRPPSSDGSKHRREPVRRASSTGSMARGRATEQAQHDASGDWEVTSVHTQPSAVSMGGGSEYQGAAPVAPWQAPATHPMAAPNAWQQQQQHQQQYPYQQQHQQGGGSGGRGVAAWQGQSPHDEPAPVGAPQAAHHTSTGQGYGYGAPVATGHLTSTTPPLQYLQSSTGSFANNAPRGCAVPYLTRA